jgi:hypothetical protein
MSNKTTTKEKEIGKKVDKLKENILRDIEKIHKDTYIEIGKIMKEQDKDRIKKIKRDIKALKS